MPKCVKMGDIQEIYELREIIWTILDFFSIHRNDMDIIESPTFRYNGSSLCFHLLPKSADEPALSMICLFSLAPLEYPVMYDLKLRKLCGSVELLRKGLLKKGENQPICFKLSEELEHECKMTLLSEITIICTLRRASVHSDQKCALNKRKLIKLDTLSENFKNLIANKDSCDTTLHVQYKQYKAHRAVLIARSPVFAAMFLHDTSEKQTGIVTIPDCDPESFEEFLKFLYCGELEHSSSISALHLYETSDKYEVEELKAFSVEYLMENLTVEDVCDVVILAAKYEEGDLLNAAQDFFNKNANKIIETSQWDCLVKNNYRLSKKLLREMIESKNH